jgi:hypothetical protein
VLDRRLVLELTPATSSSGTQPTRAAYAIAALMLDGPYVMGPGAEAVGGRSICFF